jgi:hypothetical protein
MPATSVGSCFPAELLEQLKEQLPEALFASLSGTVATTVATYEEQLGAASKQLDTTKSELQYARLKIQVLEEHLRLRRIAKYSEWMQQCGKKLLDKAGIVKEACFRQLLSLVETCTARDIRMRRIRCDAANRRHGILP